MRLRSHLSKLLKNPKTKNTKTNLLVRILGEGTVNVRFNALEFGLDFVCSISQLGSSPELPELLSV